MVEKKLRLNSQKNPWNRGDCSEGEVRAHYLGEVLSNCRRFLVGRCLDHHAYERLGSRLTQQHSPGVPELRRRRYRLDILR